MEKAYPCQMTYYQKDMMNMIMMEWYIAQKKKKKTSRIEMHEETLNCTLILNLPCTAIKEVCSSRPWAKIQLLTTTLHTFLEPEILTWLQQYGPRALSTPTSLDSLF